MLLTLGRGKGLFWVLLVARAVVIFNPKVQIAITAFSRGKAALRGNGAINEPGWAPG